MTDQELFKLIHERFNYVDGELIYRISFSNQLKVGDAAGWLHHKGHKSVTIKAKTYQLHRLIFLYHHGFLPIQVDHRDRVKTNNKISNLRPANNRKNKQNVGLTKTNTSGHKNVEKIDNRYYVRVSSQRFGGYAAALEAHLVATYQRWMLHGEFACHG